MRPLSDPYEAQLMPEMNSDEVPSYILLPEAESNVLARASSSSCCSTLVSSGPDDWTHLPEPFEPETLDWRQWEDFEPNALESSVSEPEVLRSQSRRRNERSHYVMRPWSAETI